MEVIVNGYILDVESQMHGKSIECLLFDEIDNKVKATSLEEYSEFVRMHPSMDIKSKDDIMFVKNYIHRKNTEKRHQEYFDSLYLAYNVKIGQPRRENRLYIPNNEPFKYYPNQRNEIVIISDFKCPACRDAKKELNKLQLKYENLFQFRHLQYSDQSSLGARALEAATLQGKRNEMLGHLMKGSFSDKDTNYFFHLAQDINLDIAKFNIDLFSNEVARIVSNQNYHIKKNNIYSIPRFILNGIILPDHTTVAALDSIIHYQLN